MRWLVVGLGNPGPEYAGTPHNVGFDVVDALASASRTSLVSKHEGLYGVGAVEGADGDVALLKPLTYMNLSGKSVAALARFFKIEPDEIVVAHDELDLPPGQSR